MTVEPPALRAAAAEEEVEAAADEDLASGLELGAAGRCAGGGGAGSLIRWRHSGHVSRTCNH
jgi:hypothetical protein